MPRKTIRRRVLYEGHRFMVLHEGTALKKLKIKTREQAASAIKLYHSLSQAAHMWWFVETGTNLVTLSSGDGHLWLVADERENQRLAHYLSLKAEHWEDKIVKRVNVMMEG